MTKNPVFYQRTKHIDTRFHFIRDLIKDNVIEIKYCPTEHMLADILTKALAKDKFESLRLLLNGYVLFLLCSLQSIWYDTRNMFCLMISVWGSVRIPWSYLVYRLFYCCEVIYRKDLFEVKDIELKKLSQNDYVSSLENVPLLIKLKKVLNKSF